MTQQIVNTGTGPGTGTGEPLRTAFTKINQNFTELYNGFANIALTGNAVANIGNITPTSVNITIQQATVTSVAGRSGNVSLTINDIVGGVSKAYVDSAIASANSSANLSYATTSTAGTVKVGANLSINGSGVLNTNFPVTSVNGQTGAVNLNVSDISGAASITYVNNNINSIVGSFANTTSINQINGSLTAINVAVASKANISSVYTKTEVDLLLANVGTGNVGNLATVANTGSYNDLINKPSLFSGLYVDLIGAPTANPDTVASGLTAANVRIATLESNAGVQATSLTSLLSNAASQSSAIDNLISNAASQQSSLTTLNSGLNAANVNIASLLSTSSTHTGQISALQSNASVQDSAIVALQSNAAVQQSAITTLQSNAGVQADALTSLTSNAAVQHDTFTGGLTAANVNIASLLSTTSTHTGQISALQSNAATQDASIIALQSNAAVQAGQIADLLSSNSSVQSAQIDALFANAAVQHTTFTGGLNAANLNIASLLSTTSTQTGQISALQSNAGVQADAISVLQSNAATQQSAITTLQSNASSQQSAITSLQSNAAVQHDTFTGGLTAANVNIATLLGTTGTHTSQISALQSNAATQDSTLTTLVANAATQSASLDSLTANAASQAVSITTLLANAATQHATLAAKADLSGALFTGIVTAPNVTLSSSGGITFPDSTRQTTAAVSYTLPDASSSTLGGVRTGAGINNTSGNISVTTTSIGAVPTTALGVTVATLTGGKVPTAQLPSNIVNAMTYAGVWNARDNAPTLSSGSGTSGAVYRVFVAGTTSLDGQSNWNLGDYAVFNGTTWDKWEGQAVEVLSVAGRTGNVVLTTADITNIANVATSGSYTDLINVPALANVATSGSYNDLTNRPTIPTHTGNLINNSGFVTSTQTDLLVTTVDFNSNLALKANISSLANVAFTGNYNQLINRPTLSNVATTGSYNDLLNSPKIPNLEDIYISPVDSAVLTYSNTAVKFAANVEFRGGLTNIGNLEINGLDPTVTYQLPNKTDTSYVLGNKNQTAKLKFPAQSLLLGEPAGIISTDYNGNQLTSLEGTGILLRGYGNVSTPSQLAIGVYQNQIQSGHINNPVADVDLVLSAQQNGNIILNGNGLRFPDGSIQYTAQVISTGDLRFDGNTLTTYYGDSGITINASGNGEIVLDDYTGINNINPGYWLHVGNQTEDQNTGAVAIDFSNGSSHYGDAVWTWDWSDASGNSSIGGGPGTHAVFGLYRNGSIGQRWIGFDIGTPNNTIYTDNLGSVHVPYSAAIGNLDVRSNRITTNGASLVLDTLSSLSFVTIPSSGGIKVNDGLHIQHDNDNSLPGAPATNSFHATSGNIRTSIADDIRLSFINIPESANASTVTGNVAYDVKVQKSLGIASPLVFINGRTATGASKEGFVFNGNTLTTINGGVNSGYGPVEMHLAPWGDANVVVSSGLQVIGAVYGNGNVLLGNDLKFADGSVQTTAANTAALSLLSTVISDIATLQSNVADIESNVSTVFANIGGLADSISTLTANAVTQDNSLTVLNGNIYTLTVTTNNQSNEINNLWIESNAQAVSISTLTANAGIQQGEVDSLWANAGVQSNAIAGLAPISNPTFTSNITVTDTVLANNVTVTTRIRGPLYSINTNQYLGNKSSATGTVVHDFTESDSWFHTGVVSNFTVNVTNLPDDNANRFVVTILIKQGATPYIPNAFELNGVSTSITWLGGTPSGNATKIEKYTFEIYRTSLSVDYVLGSQAVYG